MAIWLFRRKSRRKRSRSGTRSDGEGSSGPGQQHNRRPTRVKTEPEPAAPLSQPQLNKQRNEPNKLHRRARTYSFETGRQDDINVGPKRSTRKRGSVPYRASGSQLATMRIEEGADGSDSALGEDVFERVPTLHNKRDGGHLMPRKKSSKRRKAEHDREAEIKAMSNFMPVRPATEQWQAGRPMKKDTRRVKTGLGLGLGRKHSWEKDNPSSDVSLPIPESIHSSLSSDSEQISYKLSAFDSLAPRPTLRYAVYPRWVPPSTGSDPERMPSQRRKLSERGPIPEATLKAHKRIDDLADDLSASDLRELMERDQRRRDRKRQREQDKIERRLARRAEKQRAAEKEGRESPPNMERGVLGREAVGLGIDTSTSAVVTSSKRRPSDVSSKQLGKRPDGVGDQEAQEEDNRDPVREFHRTDSVPIDVQAPDPEQEDPVPPMPQSPKFKGGFLRSKKSRSKSPPLSEREKRDTSDSLRKGSESSSAKGGMSWASIFRWGNRKRSSGPSSFSNTSRDSMAMNNPPPAPTVNYVPMRKMSSGVPKRTMSRFREDLPELPISPPDSRIQSPETDPIHPAIMEQDSPSPDATAEHVQVQGERYDTPTSGHRSIEGEIMRETPTSWTRHGDMVDPSPEPQSMSLASIDSEASWLSGRLTARRRSSNAPMSQPQSRQQHHRENSGSNDSDDTHHDPDLPRQEEQSPEDESTFIADDEYLSRFANHRSSGSQWTHRKSTGEARPSSDEDEEAHWGSVGGRQPTMVQTHVAERMKSREGILNSYGEEEESDEADVLDDEKDIVEIDEEKVAGLQRATSVNLGKGHARHISAGSAKLLDLTPRTSVDAKRRSFEPRPAT